MSKEKILLHACCATCAGYVLDKLEADFIPVIYFYNPNIYPADEYYHRKNELQEYAAKRNILFIEEEYNPVTWAEIAKGLETEPEKGSRCTQCFKLRLEKTSSYALDHGYRIFTTTLTISPHKHSKTILKIGEETAQHNNLRFLAEDFKKRDGFKQTMAIAKKENFYRQNYCGCLYSQK